MDMEQIKRRRGVDFALMTGANDILSLVIGLSIHCDGLLWQWGRLPMGI